MNWKRRIPAAALALCLLPAGTWAEGSAAASASTSGTAAPEAKPSGKRAGRQCDRLKKHLERARKRLEQATKRIEKCPQAKRAEAQKLLDEAAGHVQSAEKLIAEQKCGEGARALRLARMSAQKAAAACRSGRGPKGSLPGGATPSSGDGASGDAGSDGPP